MEKNYKNYCYTIGMKRIAEGARDFSRNCGKGIGAECNLSEASERARAYLSKALHEYSPVWDERGEQLTLRLPEQPSGWWWLRTDLEIIMATGLLWQAGRGAVERARRACEGTVALVRESLRGG